MNWQPNVSLAQSDSPQTENTRLSFDALPDLPDEIGVAGPIVGVHSFGQLYDPPEGQTYLDTLIVAGGANFALPSAPDLWELPKRYHAKVWLLSRFQELDGTTTYAWEEDDDGRFPRLSKSVGYPSVVSTPDGVYYMGGENEDGPTDRVFKLALDVDKGGKFLSESQLSDLPLPCTGGAAARIGEYIYVVAGQVVQPDGGKAASRIVWRAKFRDNPLNWELIPDWPDDGPRRMFCQAAAQHDGQGERLYVFGGRHFPDGADTSDLNNLTPSSDGWAFNPDAYDRELFNTETGIYNGPSPWKKMADLPVPLSAGTAVAYGPAHIIVPSGATLGELNKVLQSGIEMKDYDHPGFPKKAYAYHTVTNSWTEFGSTPVNQVTTPAIKWGDDIVLVSGEIRPRVRSNKIWNLSVKPNQRSFGAVNMSVVVLYLLAMVGIGVYFTFRNKSTDDYFRGGKSIPWWAAGCSIFATMLSSITYMAVPAKAFAQDWVYWVGNFLILGIAPIAIYVALPFFRRIDATSAYEYLEKRFNRTARLIGSGSFSLFHIFRMGVVLALAALALASITPLTPAQCVIVMGALSIIYCTLGGVEAVIWTDTIQTVILIGGAILCLSFALIGSDSGSFSDAVSSGKFHMVNLEFGSTSFTTMALWVVILGGVGQNLASYTADQAVIQRYMTTENERLAAKSIWLNAWLAIPASAIFFGLGTAFWMFYRSNPEKLDPSMAADGIMPLFISCELPIGLAGLVVAGIFAAAQSTVSTSMNSSATTIVTDFLRPLNFCKSERSYLNLARIVTLGMGIMGTLTGLFFVDPTIKSLFDQFIGILGMFLGVLAGLFALGATTRRASGIGSLIGAVSAIVAMSAIVLAANDKTIFNFEIRELLDSLGPLQGIYRVNGYLYAFIGIMICYIVGYLASFIFRRQNGSLDGLTIWDSKK